MNDDRNYPDLMTREAEEELEERYATFGPPSPVSDALREFMRGQYAARRLEKAAAAEASAKYYLLTAAGRRAALRVSAAMQESHENYIREHGLEETHAEVVRCLAEAKARALKENHE